jgi:hypothetical protein
MDDPSTADTGITREWFDPGEFYWLWILVATTYGAGDVLTTLTITGSHTGVTEANGIVAAAIAQFGPAGLVAVKLGIILAGVAASVYGVAVLSDRTVYYAPPALLAVTGAFATVYNLVLLVA